MADTRHNLVEEHNPITGEVEARTWTDDEGVEHHEFIEQEYTPEQLARLERFTGPLFEEEKEYIAKRTEQTEKRRAARRAKKAETPAE